jgi:hypothetical protein
MRRSGGSRRRKDWQSNSFQENVPGNILGGSSLLASQWLAPPADTFGEDPSTNQIEQEEDNTLVRLFVAATISGTSLASGPGVAFFGAGIIVWEANDQFVPNPLTLPHPVLDADADWVWNWTQALQAVGPLPQTASNVVSPAESQYQVKSKRKLSSKKGLLFIAEIDATFSSQTWTDMEYSAWARWLVLLA